MPYEPGRIGRAIREGGASIGQALRQLGSFRYRAARQEELDAHREEARRYRRERDEFNRFAKGASAVGNAQTIQEADALSRVFRPHLGRYGPALMELAAATPVPEDHTRLPGVPGVNVEAPEFAGGGRLTTPGRDPRDIAIPEPEEPNLMRVRGFEFDPTDEAARANVLGVERDIARARRRLSGPDGPSTIKLGGREFPDTPRGRTEALIWKRESSEAGSPADEYEGGGLSGAVDAVTGGGGGGVGRFRAGTVNPYADPNFGPVGTDTPGREIPGRENGPDPVAPATRDTLSLAGPRRAAPPRPRPDVTDPRVLADMALAKGADPTDVLEALLRAGVPEDEARRFVGR